MRAKREKIVISLNELGQYQRRRRLYIAVVIAFLVVPLLFIRSTWDHLVHEYIEVFGLGLIIAAIVGRMWCTLYIGGRKNQEIVRSGPYSMSRNPLYVFSAIGAMGIGAQTGSLVLTITLGLLCYVAFSFVMRTEERFLARHFGEPYLAYCREVRRFFPKISLYTDDPELTVKPDRIYRTLLDGMVFFIAYPFMEFVEYLQNTGVINVVINLF